MKYNNQSHIIQFSNGTYNVSGISDIINLEIKEKFNIEDQPIKLVVDINRYRILIIVKENWQLILDKHFMELLGFDKFVIKAGYNRSDKLPKIDKSKYLKIYSNIVDNFNDKRFLTNVLIENKIGDLITYNNLNIFKKQRILESEFRFIEVCIKNQHNQNMPLKDFYQISLYIS